MLVDILIAIVIVIVAAILWFVVHPLLWSSHSRCSSILSGGAAVAIFAAFTHDIGYCCLADEIRSTTS